MGEDGDSDGGGERGRATVRGGHREEGTPTGWRETHRQPSLHEEEDRRSTHGVGCYGSEKFDHVSTIARGGRWDSYYLMNWFN